MLEFLWEGLKTIVGAVLMILIGLILIGSVLVSQMDAILAVFRSSPNAAGYAPTINFIVAVPFLFGCALMIIGFYVSINYFRRK